MSSLSERGYFSLRYAVPGFTFILLIIGINFFPLSILLSNGNGFDFGAFLAFLSLLSGSAIGFLLTQFYWLRFQTKVGILGIDTLKLLDDKAPKEIFITALAKKFELDNSKLSDISCETENRKLLAVLDHISHSEKKETLLRLQDRRWDMYHLLATTEHALMIGIFCGIILRIICLVAFCFANIGELGNDLEIAVLVPIVILVGILLCILPKSKIFILTEHTHLLEARIRTSNLTLLDLVNAFPSFIFEYSTNAVIQKIKLKDIKSNSKDVMSN